ncbi:MAG: 50S ribosomal protein L11 methyltransferase [Bacteroidia bacterium]
MQNKLSYHSIHIKCNDQEAELASAVLLDKGYAGTSYEDGILVAYVDSRQYAAEDSKSLIQSIGLTIDKEYQSEDQNWNELWESNFHETIIDDRIQIRAPFHKSKGLEYELIIHPKMAFGTGHHGTTQLMLRAMLRQDFKGATVLDMGCGSGILAIMAMQLGAKSVDAIDYDINSIVNCKENVQLNVTPNVNILQAENLEQVTKTFDIILSNIVKNINLSLLPQFAAKLSTSGTLILCGLLENDLKEAQTVAEALNLKLINHTSNGEWLQLAFIKPI